jgi:C-terminal processing protease CtpA/Prc
VTGVHDILIPAEGGGSPMMFVMLVSPGSPAADAGIEAGEVITEVDGRAPGDPLAVLSGPAGERVTLRVRKGVKQTEPTRTVTLVRADEMQSGEFLLPNLGLALVRSAGGRVHVLISIAPAAGLRGAVEMSTDSPAYAAGVRSRQEIVSIDGRPATEWSPKQLVALASLPDGAEVALGVRHPRSEPDDPPLVVKVKTKRSK